MVTFTITMNYQDHYQYHDKYHTSCYYNNKADSAEYYFFDNDNNKSCDPYLEYMTVLVHIYIVGCDVQKEFHAFKKRILNCQFVLCSKLSLKIVGYIFYIDIHSSHLLM